MKAILYRTFSWEIEVPDDTPMIDRIHLSSAIVAGYLDKHGWPSREEGQEFKAELTVYKTGS